MSSQRALWFIVSGAAGIIMAHATKIVFAGACVALLLAVGPSCGGERVAVNERMFLRDREMLTPNGGGCQWTNLPGSSGGSAVARPGNFELTEGADGDAFLVRVFSDQQLLASRRYDLSTLQSAKVDEFAVTTHSGAVFVLRYWGGTCADLDAAAP